MDEDLISDESDTSSEESNPDAASSNKSTPSSTGKGRRVCLIACYLCFSFVCVNWLDSSKFLLQHQNIAMLHAGFFSKTCFVEEKSENEPSSSTEPSSVAKTLGQGWCFSS